MGLVGFGEGMADLMIQLLALQQRMFGIQIVKMAFGKKPARVNGPDSPPDTGKGGTPTPPSSGGEAGEGEGGGSGGGNDTSKERKTVADALKESKDAQADSDYWESMGITGDLVILWKRYQSRKRLEDAQVNLQSAIDALKAKNEKK
jgi:hypothetical protein